jgi:hypothetical protein
VRELGKPGDGAAVVVSHYEAVLAVGKPNRKVLAHAGWRGRRQELAT